MSGHTANELYTLIQLQYKLMQTQMEEAHSKNDASFIKAGNLLAIKDNVTNFLTKVQGRAWQDKKN